MTISVTRMALEDRADWEPLYYGYAKFYRVEMNPAILDTLWGWIHDDANAFFGLIARDADGQAVGLMHCRRMPSPLRGAQVGLLDDLFVVSESRGQAVVEALYAALNRPGQAQGRHRAGPSSAGSPPKTTTAPAPFTTGCRRRRIGSLTRKPSASRAIAFCADSIETAFS